MLDGRRLVNFSSNDYLGLAAHPEVCRTAAACATMHGFGSGASRLVSGDDPLLHQLEKELAAWKGFESALLVGSGMLANLGVLPALAQRHDAIFCDRLNHASLLDGSRLSGARVRRFPHLNMARLEENLAQCTAERKIIVSDGVFSMDGDCADVAELLRLSEEHDALLVLDDAHGLGVVGADGRGVSAAAGMAGHARLLETGTCGKALGSYGAFILGANGIIEGLRQRLRTMIYSTALPPAVCAASLAALQLIRQGDAVRKLRRNISLFRQLAAAHALPLTDSETAIQPLILGADDCALGASRQLAERGFYVCAIRPPTVPEGSARLRITLSAAHDEDDIAGLVSALVEVLQS